MDIQRFKFITSPLYVFLFALYPILYLLAANVVFIAAPDAVRSLMLALACACFFLLAFWLILKSWTRAGLLSCLIMLLFFSFGHVANVLTNLFAAGGRIFPLRLLGWAWLLIFLLLSYAILKIKSPEKIAVFLNITGLVLLLFPLYTFGETLVVTASNNVSADERLAQLRGQENATASLTAIPPEELPDIFTIILDGYARTDKLAEYYQYDNEEFIEGLQARGFYVAQESRSNFLVTTYSLNSLVNLIPISEFPLSIFRQARYNLQQNYVSDFLRGEGYEIVVLDSGTGDTNNQYADQFITPISPAVQANNGLNAFEKLLLRTTPALLLVRSVDPEASRTVITSSLIASVNQDLDQHRARISTAFEQMPEFATYPGPVFMFTHIYSPHLPFLYGPGGSELKFHGQENLYWYEVAPENYVEQYDYQIDYLNTAVIETIDRILANAKRPLIIVLQSDHGDDFFLDWHHPDNVGVDIRSANLNAIYYSDGDYSQMYPSMTTVNTFRLVLNHWFGTGFPLLEDRVYFHEFPLETPPRQKPDFFDACLYFEICPPGTHAQ
ncbi:MAG: hypothetical protein ACK2UW_00330 [Anaerolineales bacterium]